MAINTANFIDNNCTIANGGTTSGVVDLQGRGLVAFILPAAFTGTAITFQVSADGTNFYDCYNSANSQMTCTVTQGRAYMLDPGDLVAVRFIKLVSNAAEGAERTITLIARDLQ